MRAFVASPPRLSQAMFRVAAALTRHAPADVTIVSDKHQADVVLLHTIGYPETVTALDELEAAGKRAVIAQYCLRTTQEPKVEKWLPLWARAAMVWSYYDLVGMAFADGFDPISFGFNFYYSPLGSDPFVFSPTSSKSVRDLYVLTSGYVAESEFVSEVNDAVLRIKGAHMAHLGPSNVVRGPHVEHYYGIIDQKLRDVYSRCKFVSGLRHLEGFELPAVEGFLCGARPLLFDRSHHHEWWGDRACYVAEGTRPEISRQVEAILRGGAPPVTPEERFAAVKMFSWNTIAGEFWRRVKEAV